MKTVPEKKKVNKMLRRWLALVLAVVMMVPGSYVSPAVMVLAETVEDYIFDLSPEGNGAVDSDGNLSSLWTESNGYYVFSATSDVATQGIFTYYGKGSKMKLMANQYMQFDGSANKSGQATVSIDLVTDGYTSDDTFDMAITYSSKGSESILQMGTSVTTGSAISCSSLSNVTGENASNASTSDTVTYVTTLTGGQAYLIGAKNGMRMYGLVVSKVEPVTITGMVSAYEGSVLPESAAVVFTGTDGTAYSGAMNADGSYSVAIPASSIEKDYTVSFSDAAYVLNPELDAITVSHNMTDTTVDLTVQKADAYTLSGTYTTGLEGNEGNITAITFKPVTESTYTVPEVEFADGNYSVKLEKGTTYKVTVEGVNDYTLTNGSDICYSADTVLDLAFEKKATYPVTLLTGSTPDVTGMSLEYIYTHEDGSVYTFTDADGITLRDGSYTFTVGGDIEKLAYKVSEGTSLTVAGAAVNHIVKYAQVTSWSFGSNVGGFAETIQSGTGWYQGLYIDATTGKLAGRTGDAQFNSGTIINVPVDGTCKISVTAYQAQYALYTISAEGNDTVTASIENATTEYDYTGEAGVVSITSTGSAYITGITVTYPEKEVEYVEQTEMPAVAGDDTDANTALDTDGIPRASKADTVTVQPVGQKLTLTQSGGSFGVNYEAAADTGYYLFPATDEIRTLEFDLVVNSAGTANGDGVYMGLFTDNYAYTLGVRKGGTNARTFYSKAAAGTGNQFAGAGGIDHALEVGERLHIVITMAGGKSSITYTVMTGSLKGQTGTASSSILAEENTGFYYGLAIADASVTISNMVFTAADGTVVYNQNSCYYPEGSAPAAATVTATAAASREYIDVEWTGDIPEGDGVYVVEMSKDGGEFTELADDITTLSYRYTLPEGDGGSYTFRVCGQLGYAELGGERNDYVTSAAVSVVAALAKPELSVTAGTASIKLDWQDVEGAEYYTVYRYSYDEGEEAMAELVTVTASEYEDMAVETEMPYYYSAKAFSSDNNSVYADTVWAVATPGHTGEYVYESEATNIVITKKSYDTVFNGAAVLEGTVEGAGTIEAYVNSALAGSKELAVKETFAFELALSEGRNDAELIFTDAAGAKTRLTYNFVYLTNYDIVVDSAYTGTDGAEVNGIPTYSTVQAAVNSVSSSNTVQTVIFVKAGSYEERLEVTAPYITIIGEDRENTSIHCYPGELGTDYEAGGDMAKRCATYIYSTAAGFAAENITFANDYVYGTADGKSNKSADAIRVEADEAVFVNTKFVGVQDTLYMHQGHQYYYKCRIEGLVDFIYSGDKARAYFNDCDIVFVYESTKKSGYVCAPKTATAATYGLTFNNCRITGEEGCSGNGYLLARPWGPDAYITWINCYMGECVYALLPYGDMSGNAHTAARFFEFGTYGPGFAINNDRRQISANAAAEMISDGYLEWSPIAVSESVAAGYIGDMVTDSEDKFDEEEYVTDTYLQTDGDDTGLKAYDLEGYAGAYGVTGGGLLKETSDNYYVVSTAEEFLDALIAIKASGKNSVVEITADINLGCYEVENFDNYSSILSAYSAQALTHPVLIESGVSKVNIADMHNLTIFSSNGSSIKHTNITMKNSSNIIIRNVKFDELWEWDEATSGDYDRNDWDYMTVDTGCDGIWIDHCTFYKAYDGIVDVKNPSPVTNITISWCEFLPGSEGDVFFNAMMEEIYANPDNYPTTYQYLVEQGMTEEQIYMYAYGQKKTHLFGQSDESTNAAGIQATLANNHYKDSMDRMPRLRYGYSHVYNCVMDAKNLYDAKNSIANADIAKKIVSNGAASTCGAQMLLENCYINSIINALNSGNGSSPSGYINAVNSVYYMDGELTTLEPKSNSSTDSRVLVTDADAFTAALPYDSYRLYDAENLDVLVVPYAGAGKLNLTNLQWEKTVYEAEYVEPEITPEVTPTPEATPTPTTKPSNPGASAPSTPSVPSVPSTPDETPEATPAPEVTQKPEPTKFPKDFEFNKGDKDFKVVEPAKDGKGKVYMNGMHSIKNDKKFTSLKTANFVNAGGDIFRVAAICEEAFKDYRYLEKVVIGNTVRIIGKDAFENCTSLEKVYIGTSIYKISYGAFNGCTNLKEIVIYSDELKTVGKNIFKGVSDTVVIKVPADRVEYYSELFADYIKTGAAEVVARN